MSYHESCVTNEILRPIMLKKVVRDLYKGLKFFDLILIYVVFWYTISLILKNNFHCFKIGLMEFLAET